MTVLPIQTPYFCFLSDFPLKTLNCHAIREMSMIVGADRKPAPVCLTAKVMLGSGLSMVTYSDGFFVGMLNTALLGYNFLFLSLDWCVQ